MSRSIIYIIYVTLALAAFLSWNDEFKPLIYLI